jgi:oligoribonuclease NrnB/cAMP/cGMP phosphodiesterase (DHH superfamily)
MKTYVLYHANCADGFASAFVAWLKLGNSAEYIAVKYGDAPPKMETDSKVYILDFSYSRAALEVMSAFRDVTVIDHHKTAQKELEGVPFATFDMEHSGCVLTWKHFFPEEIAPDFLGYIQDRDLWRFKMEGSKEVNAAIATYPYDFEKWSILCTLGMELIPEGRTALRVIEREAKRTAASALLQRVGASDCLAPVVNCTAFISETCHEMLALHTAPFVAAYFDDLPRGKRVWSLRSRPGFDVSDIARSMGGGGHAQAAGFEERLPDASLCGVKNQLEIQGQNGNWNCNPYMHGFYNGLECAAATAEGREAHYRDAPEKWLCDNPNTTAPAETTSE